MTTCGKDFIWTKREKVIQLQLYGRLYFAKKTRILIHPHQENVSIPLELRAMGRERFCVCLHEMKWCCISSESGPWKKIWLLKELGHRSWEPWTNWHVRSLATLKLPCWKNLVERAQGDRGKSQRGLIYSSPQMFVFFQARAPDIRGMCLQIPGPSLWAASADTDWNRDKCPCQPLPTLQIYEQSKCFFKPLCFRVVGYTLADD